MVDLIMFLFNFVSVVTMGLMIGGSGFDSQAN